MSEKINQETSNEVTEPQEKIQEQVSSEELKFTELKFEDTKSENSSWLKHRLERAKEQGVKSVLEKFGVNSVDEIKDVYKKLEETSANYEKAQKDISQAQVSEQKYEVLKSGFDEKFIDFIVHTLKDKVTEKEDFSSLLSKFKNENQQYLKAQNSGIKISTSPNFESSSAHQKPNEIINNLIRGAT